ncbi:MAG: hypothetical protein GY789_20655 [Hyphomicrobiales bacterium]|nr:hypothetical protein [Hyphomicrobiales bacterium]
MTLEEFEEKTARLSQINVEIQDLMPSIMRSGGSQETARIDAAIWAERLQPLFDEHHRISEELKQAIVSPKQ